MTTESEDILKQGLGAIDRLATLIAEETRLVAEGRIADGLALAAEKAEQAHTLDLTLRALRNGTSAPSVISESLGQRIEAIQETLAANLAVLSTSRAVAEGLLRDVARKLSEPLNGSYGPGVTRGASGSPLILSRAT